MGFSNPIIGGGGTLVREAIRSPDYVPGVSGWTINRDGSAEFNDVQVRGDFATGAAGGPDAYLTIDDSTDRTTISFWNAAGTKNAFINSPAGPTTPRLGLNSGLYELTPGVDGKSRLLLGEGSITMSRVRASDQVTVGGRLLIDDSAWLINGSNWVQVDTNRVFITAGSNSISVRDDGVRTSGDFVSTIGWSFAPAAGWSVGSVRFDRWGPFVHANITVTATAGLAAGPNTAQVGTFTSAGNVPISETPMAGNVDNNHAVAAFFNSTGLVRLRWLSGAVAVGDIMRLSVTYFRT